MPFVCAIDIFGVRWFQFKSVYRNITGQWRIDALRDLSRYVHPDNMCMYSDLKLKEPLRNQGFMSVYINDAGLKEYICSVQTEDMYLEVLKAIADPISHVNFPKICEKAGIYKEEIVYFYGGRPMTDFLVVLFIDGSLWLDAEKVYNIYGYSHPWNFMKKHITPGNLKTLGELIPDANINTSTLTVDTVFMNEVGAWEVSQHLKIDTQHLWRHVVSLMDRHNINIDSTKSTVIELITRMWEIYTNVKTVPRVTF